MDYTAGDVVVCRGHGPAEIQRILPEGALVVRPLGADSDVPAASDDVLRRGMDEKQARALIDRIPFLRTIQAPVDKARYELYDDAMDQYDPAEWVRVIKSVYLRGKEKPLTDKDHGYFEQAQRYLHGELARALSLPEQAVEAHIAACVRENL